MDLCLADTGTSWLQNRDAKVMNSARLQLIQVRIRILDAARVAGNAVKVCTRFLSACCTLLEGKFFL
jgi:hypothetical protein